MQRFKKFFLVMGFLLLSCWTLQVFAADLNVKEDTVPPEPEGALSSQSITPVISTPSQNPQQPTEKSNRPSS